MLVWVDSLIEINDLLVQFKATVPMDNIDDAFFVSSLYNSDKPSPFLSVNVEGSVSKQSFQPSKTRMLIFEHTCTTFFLLRSRMDVQTTDGKAALMRYVSSYVSKLSENVDLLCNIETSTFLQVSSDEPEMTMSFSSNKILYCNLSHVKVNPPKPEYMDNP